MKHSCCLCQRLKKEKIINAIQFEIDNLFDEAYGSFDRLLTKDEAQSRGVVVFVRD